MTLARNEGGVGRLASVGSDSLEMGYDEPPYAEGKSKGNTPVVTIFGAGVAGLSAAHELIQRGFVVQVVESNADPDCEYECDVGGLAKSQWGRIKQTRRVHWPLYTPIEIDEFRRQHPRLARIDEEQAMVAKSRKQKEKRQDLGQLLKTMNELRERPFQQVQKRFPLPQRIALPVEHDLDVYDAAISRFNLEPWYAAASMPSRSKVNHFFELYDFHGSVRRSLGSLDPLYQNRYKLESICISLIRAYLTYARQLDADLVAISRRSRGRHDLTLDGDDVFKRRETLLVEIIGYFDQPKATAWAEVREPGLLWSKFVRFLICSILHAFAPAVPKSSRKWTIPRADTAFPRLARAIAKIEANDDNEDKANLYGFLERPWIHLQCVEGTNPGNAPIADANRRDALRMSNFVAFRVVEHVVAGEHGFRFFPGFYRHLFDTMKRTPILDAQKLETRESVFDNLVEMPPVRLGVANRPPFRTLDQAKSVEDARDQLKWLVDDVGLSIRDLLRHNVQLLKLLTSCRDRRDLYENMSWMQFVDGRSEYETPNPEQSLDASSFSATADSFIRNLPALLVAMSAEETDALTNGSIAVQMSLHPGGRMLSGPTSDAWLMPWKQYLKRQGVRFFVGKLCGLRFAEDNELQPIVNGDCVDGSPIPENPFHTYIDHNGTVVAPDLSGEEREPSSDFFVLALDYRSATRHLSDVTDTALTSKKERFHKVLEKLKKAIAFGLPKLVPSNAATVRGLTETLGRCFAIAEDSARTYKQVDEALMEVGSQLKVYSAAFPNWRVCLKLYFSARRAIDRASLCSDVGCDVPPPLDEAKLKLEKSRVRLRLDGDLAQLLEMHRQSSAPLDHTADTGNGSFQVKRDADGRPQPRFRYPLRDLVGIQFYFREHVRIAQGHFILPYSEWGLSGIAQGNIWRTAPARDAGYRGQLSIDIGSFYTPFENKRSGLRGSAWTSTPVDLATATWSQIVVAAEVNYADSVVPPRYFHIDDGLKYDATSNTPNDNHNMLMINLPGQWRLRPGLALEDRGVQKVRYRVSNGRWVMAGNFMATTTRLSTMESANESGRHAANAIIRELSTGRMAADRFNGGGLYSGDHADIWDPQLHEFPDLEPLKRIDKALFDKRVPHLLDVLGIAKLIDRIPLRADPRSTPVYNLASLLKAAITEPTSSWDFLSSAMPGIGSANLDGLLQDLIKIGSISSDVLDMMVKSVSAQRKV